MDFKELERQVNKNQNLLRLYQKEENKKYEEAREILRRLFPQERVIDNFVRFYNWENEMYGYKGSFFSELLDCEGQDSLKLRRSSSIRTCYCGCNSMEVIEDYYIRSSEFDEDKAMRGGSNEKGWMETRLLSRGLIPNGDFWAQVNPDFERVVPGAMDEWFKMQFEAKDHN